MCERPLYRSALRSCTVTVVFSAHLEDPSSKGEEILQPHLGNSAHPDAETNGQFPVVMSSVKVQVSHVMPFAVQVKYTPQGHHDIL